MKNYFKFICTFLFFIFFIFNGFCQKAQLNKANKLYENYSFLNAQKEYLKVKNIHNNSSAMLNLANSYYYNSNYIEALHWYNLYYSLVKIKKSDAKNYFFYYYLNCLRANKQYSEAILSYATATGKESNQAFENNFSGVYKYNKSKVNKDFDTYGISYSNDKNESIVFSSNRTINAKGKTTLHSWNNKPYLKLFSGVISNDGEITSDKTLTGDLLKYPYHQSNPTISANGKKMYFTRSIYKDVSYKESFLMIYCADYINGEWTNITELASPVNRIGTSSAHPTISPDNKLYFVSNREDRRNSDIYYIQLNDNYVLTPKENVVKLSDKVNTPGRENFVFASSTGVIYFSSDGHPGIGGLDLFAARYDGKDYSIVNLGESINSPLDDFSLFYDDKTKKGFFSSNRELAGIDLLYKFEEVEPIIWNFNVKPKIKGIVKDSLTNMPISNAELIFKTLGDKSEIITKTLSDENGLFSVEIPPYTDVTSTITAENFTSKEVRFNKMDPTQETNVEIYLFNQKTLLIDDKIVELKSGQDLTEVLNLKPIYFDYNGFAIRKSSKLELDKIIKLLSERDNITIEIKSHTDNRGKDDYNMALSNNRAKATIKYIIENSNKKIAIDRVFGMGYGESNLKINCRPSECTEEEHAENRRSEFILNFK